MRHLMACVMIDYRIAILQELVNHPTPGDCVSADHYNQCRDAIASGNPVEAAKQVNRCIDFLTAEQLAKLQLMLTVKVWEGKQ